jgi:hypothetical protein
MFSDPGGIHLSLGSLGAVVKVEIRGAEQNFPKGATVGIN